MADWTEWHPVITWQVYCPRCDRTWLRDTAAQARDDSRRHDRHHAKVDEGEQARYERAERAARGGRGGVRGTTPRRKLNPDLQA